MKRTSNSAATTPKKRRTSRCSPFKVPDAPGSARRRPMTASWSASTPSPMTTSALTRVGSGRWRRTPGGGWGHSASPVHGPASLPAAPDTPLPETEQECAQLFQDRIQASHGRQLLPLVEDLADWINKTLGLDCLLNAENFFDLLDNGVLLCRLGRLIQENAQRAAERGEVSTPVPMIRGRCWDNAARKSFFSRDNMENFIQFCRRLGVHDNLLFESDDLVLHNQPRNVVLCLMEVSRLASRYGMEPPGLVQLEKEIAEEEAQDSGLSHSSLMSWQFQASPALTPRSSPDKIRHSSSSSAISAGSGGRWGGGRNRPRSGERRSLLLESSPPPHEVRRTVSEGNTAREGASDGVPSDTTEDDWSRGSGDDPDLDLDPEPTVGRPEELSELDRKVQQATRLAQRQCHCPSSKCPKLKVRKVGEGKYNIAGRNVFVRLLKGRHMMVRVGGGWDTLDHFLLRHDPCQVKVVSRDSPYLHITAKYRSNSHASR